MDGVEECLAARERELRRYREGGTG